MNVGEIARIGTENSGRKIVVQRRLDAFDRLRLAPALHTVLVGQPDQNRRPRTRLEEFEFSKQRIVQSFDIDTGNPSHLGSNPLGLPHPSIFAVFHAARGLAFSLTIWLDRRERNYQTMEKLLRKGAV